MIVWRNIVAESMGYEAEDLPREIPLIELGLDSLMAMRIKNRAEWEFDIPQLQLQAMRDANLQDVVKFVTYAVEHRDEVQALAAEAEGKGELDTAALAELIEAGDDQRRGRARSTGTGDRRGRDGSGYRSPCRACRRGRGRTCGRRPKPLPLRRTCRIRQQSPPRPAPMCRRATPPSASPSGCGRW